MIRGTAGVLGHEKVLRFISLSAPKSAAEVWSGQRGANSPASLTGRSATAVVGAKQQLLALRREGARGCARVIRALWLANGYRMTFRAEVAEAFTYPFTA